MRIIAGTHKSRTLYSLVGDSTRPTLDKVKEALFGKIGPWIKDKHVLDLFAGSGNIGCEALSRGAASCTFVEGSQAAMNIVKKNLESLNFKQAVYPYRMDAFQACRYLKNKGQIYDFIYLDPPYGKIEIDKLLSALLILTHADSMIVLEHPKDFAYHEHEAYTLDKKMDYGSVALFYLRRKP